MRDPRGFLYVTTTNLARDQWRRKQREHSLVLRIRTTVRDPAYTKDPDLRDVVDRLPERMRIPVLLFYYADMTIAQVATACRRPEGTVKRTLSEARAALKLALTTD